MSLMTRRIDLGAADRNVRRPRCFDLEIFGMNMTTSIIGIGGFGETGKFRPKPPWTDRFTFSCQFIIVS
jgi:hypothetical protein